MRKFAPPHVPGNQEVQEVQCKECPHRENIERLLGCPPEEISIPHKCHMDAKRGIEQARICLGSMLLLEN